MLCEPSAPGLRLGPALSVIAIRNCRGLFLVSYLSHLFSVTQFFAIEYVFIFFGLFLKIFGAGSILYAFCQIGFV